MASSDHYDFQAEVLPINLVRPKAFRAEVTLDGSLCDKCYSKATADERKLEILILHF